MKIAVLVIALMVGQASGQGGGVVFGSRQCHSYKDDCNTCTYCDGSNVATCTLAYCSHNGNSLFEGGSTQGLFSRPRFADLMPLVKPLPLGETSKTFHGCKMVGGSGNSPHLFDMSEVYRCDEGEIEIAGQWNETIEYGYVFGTELGRPSRGEPRKATASDYKERKWCSTPKPWDAKQKERCGDKPTVCWDGRPGTWDPKWQGYSCATPDHRR